ncbi:MAG: 4-hydroxy-3-methylbut-2-enyl diphosphate reductase [Thermodesulfobacteriota bacterium]
MKIIVAKTAGFCMGVRRAVEMVLDSPAKHQEPIFTYGPLIHNPQVLALLEEKGIRILKTIPEHGSGTVLIRAHGVPPEVKTKLTAAGFRVIDATCPRVIKVQTIIRKYTRQGYTAIIVGDRDHPEVVGLLGYAHGKGRVAADLHELQTLLPFDQAIIVAQTTQNTLLFEDIKTWVAKAHPHYKIFNTICDSTEKRQIEVKRLSEAVDAIVVVGGRESGNTQRLATIARQSGKPAYHVETEEELDEVLADVHQIGITAGASTPNWVIKRVYRTLESFPMKKGKGWRRWWFNIERSLLLTSIYVAFGAGALCYAGSKLQGIAGHLPNVLISILYVQSMHILNHLVGRKADRYNDPERASFYDNHKWPLSLLAVLAGGLGLMAAFSLGSIPFIILLGMSLTGLSYNLRIIPGQPIKGKYRKIRDIPGSKTLLITLAWGIVTSLFPSFTSSEGITWHTPIVFVWAAGMVFIRTAFFDILDMQGDRIIGKETIPILLGEKKTMRLLKWMLAAIMGILLISSILKLVPALGYLQIIPLASLLFLLSGYEKEYLLPGVRVEFLVESHFILAGMIALAWDLTAG